MRAVSSCVLGSAARSGSTQYRNSGSSSGAGRKVLITGANSGIGFEAALELARKVAELILPARTQAKGENAVSRIVKQVLQARLYPQILDLAEQASIHAFAHPVFGRFPGQSIDLLMNSAGVMALPKREITADGFERQFAAWVWTSFSASCRLFSSRSSEAFSRTAWTAGGFCSDLNISK